MRETESLVATLDRLFAGSREEYLTIASFLDGLETRSYPFIVAALVLPNKSESNGVLLTLSKQVLPPWVTGLVVVAAIATAMVPAAGILIGISSLVARTPLGLW